MLHALRRGSIEVRLVVHTTKKSARSNCVACTWRARVSPRRLIARGECPRMVDTREAERHRMLKPDPSWLNPGDTAWQITAATLVGIMSVPGLAILYAGLMKRKWAVNSSLMVVYAFAMTLVIWMFVAYDMSFGQPLHVGGLATTFIGVPHPVAGATDLTQQASIPLLTGLIPALRFPMSLLWYFQFVFAAITVIILGGSLLRRIRL